MARGARPLIYGGAAAAVVAALTLGTIAAVMMRASGGDLTLAAADWAALRFTLLQAVLSAAVSVLLAIPVARALARRRFRGRGLLVTLLGAPFILPVIVAVFGLLAVYGRSGLISDLLGVVGLPPVDIYGLHGVVLAHVFFNLPLAVRLILQGWLAIPSERFRLAEVMGADVGLVLERPMLREVLPGAALVIFLICLTSFAVALILGGNPGSTTIELAIYQAFTFEGDLGKAALMSLVQVGVTVLAALLAVRFAIPAAMGAGLDRANVRWAAGSARLDAAWLVAVTVFLAVPLVLVAIGGARGLFMMPQVVWVSAAKSIAIAVSSAGLTVLLALSLSMLRVRLGRAGWVVDVASVLPLAASPLVMGTGLFLLLFPILDPGALSLPVTAVVNAIGSLPFALRALAPAVAAAEAGHGRLADSLGLTGWARMRWLVLPRCRRAIGFTLGLSAALSMGDLGVIVLFADPGGGTLPLAMHRLMGAYRTTEAAGAGLLLLILSFGLFWLFDRGGRVDAET